MVFDNYECDNQMNIYDYVSKPYRIDKTIRLIELFAGVGSQAMALRNIGANFEHYRAIEFDKYAMKSYNAIHGTNFETTDIRDIKGSDLGITETDKYCYIVTYSFPCVLAGTKVNTEDGYKNIEDVVCGDLVLTHNNKYRKVTKIMSRLSGHYNIIKGVGTYDLKLTDEHPVYVLRDGREQWVKVKELLITDKLSFNVNQENVPCDYDSNTLWLLGRYVADGYYNKRTYNSINFSISFKKENEFVSHIPKSLHGRFKKFKKKCWDYRIADNEFKELCLQFNSGAKNKDIPKWVINLPHEQLQSFFDGYISGDGHVRDRNGHTQIMFTTVSERLALSLQQIVAKLYGRICSISVRSDSRKPTYNDTYNCQFGLYEKYLHQVKIREKIFTEIKSIERIETEVQVFNIEVSEDNSYTCNNVIVHNCQDLSVAGKGAGMEKGSGTRSGLLWEVERLLNECEVLPQVLLMENVPQVHGKKNMADFEKWIDFLKSKGYSNYWQDLNAKNYGIPQNRNRCFMVSLLGDYTYEFPKPIPLTKTMKDFLEDEVDEKYYINSEKALKLIETLQESGTISRAEQSRAEQKGVRQAMYRLVNKQS